MRSGEEPLQTPDQGGAASADLDAAGPGYRRVPRGEALGDHAKSDGGGSRCIRGLSPAARGTLKAIRFYRRWISPMLPPGCRFTPSCSLYALIAVERFGFLKGSVMSAWRILRCNPFTPGGFDPVPGGPEDE